MFLITTADQHFWKTDESILFLGEWCKLFSQRHIWEKLNYEVLPYHWDDREKLYKDYLYLDGLYEKTLNQMATLLNQIHGENHSVRYWRIIIGPWLSYFTQVLFDRYQSILTAIESKRVTNTVICEYEPGKWLPNKYLEFCSWAENYDAYNHYLYDRIIEHIKILPYDVIRQESRSAKYINTVGQKTLWNKIIRSYRIIYKLSKFASNQFNKIVLVESSLNKWDLIKLCLHLGQIPHLYIRDESIPKPSIDLNLRESFCHIQVSDGFEKLLIKMIIEQIPSIYIEGYNNMKSISIKAFPRKPRIIFTSTSFNTYDAFKFWAAHHVDYGAKLVGTQHGGHYGTGLWSSSEDHQIKIYDKFYTWGWEKGDCTNITPISAAKFNEVKRRVRPRKDGRILMILGALPRYSYYMYSVFVASTGFLNYMDEQYRFIDTLSDKNKKLLTIRLFMHDYGWDHKERWMDRFSKIEYCVGKKSLIDRLDESKLAICTYNATTYLETFVANFPTVLFWNPKHWELRPSAKPYFDELRKVGVLHYTPESAAAKANDISDDPISWWQQNKIQKVKDEFCFKFARTSSNWLKEWKSELLKMYNMS